MQRVEVRDYSISRAVDMAASLCSVAANSCNPCGPGSGYTVTVEAVATLVAFSQAVLRLNLEVLLVTPKMLSFGSLD